MAYIQELFQEKIERVPSAIWDGLVDCAAKLYPGEVKLDILQAYEDGLADPTFMNISDVDRILAKDKERVLEELPSNISGPIDDAIKEMEWWACFRDTSRPAYVPPAPVPEARPTSATQKVGRNDPCPCGSGKKYKKCCG